MVGGKKKVKTIVKVTKMVKRNSKALKRKLKSFEYLSLAGMKILMEAC